MPDNDSSKRMRSSALQDQRIMELIEANKIAMPDNEVLANIYRRRGDLGAAAAEIARLHANGHATPAIALLHAAFHGQQASARPPDADFSPAPFVIVDDFFDAQTNQRLLQQAIAKQADFEQTTLQKTAQDGQAKRTNLITFDVGPIGETMRTLVRQNLPQIYDRLCMAALDVKFIELKLAAYLHGDFFKAHQDLYPGRGGRERRISFIYYFHQEPKPYTGGELLLYDTRFTPPAHVSTLYTKLIPRNNSVIFFPSQYVHEVLPVVTNSRDFNASRFTMAGHIG